MQEQTFFLENNKSFEPKHIFECGQCFRWNLQEDGSYTGVHKNNVMNVKKIDGKIKITGLIEQDIVQECIDYFGLQTNYEQIKEKLSKNDKFLKKSIEYGYGIRILNQDLFETIISFIISANNNIPRIKKIIEKICEKYGNKLEWHDKIYYTFPTVQQLSLASVSDLRQLGLGFRDVRVHDTVKMVLNKEVDLENLKTNKSYEIVNNELIKLPGVGPKVADCVMLFGLKRFEAFPVDVWVSRVMNELYGRDKLLNPKEIRKMAEQKYKNLAGIAQQYLFYWKRDVS